MKTNPGTREACGEEGCCGQACGEEGCREEGGGEAQGGRKPQGGRKAQGQEGLNPRLGRSLLLLNSAFALSVRVRS